MELERGPETRRVGWLTPVGSWVAKATSGWVRENLTCSDAPGRWGAGLWGHVEDADGVLKSDEECPEQRCLECPGQSWGRACAWQRILSGSHSQPAGVSPHGGRISDSPYIPIFPLQFIMLAKLQLRSSNKTILWRGGCQHNMRHCCGRSIGRVENHCSRVWSTGIVDGVRGFGELGK